MKTDIVALLQQLDFTEYEAKAYLALLRKSPLSGYAVALNSGVPRSKIYEVLGNMEERGEVIVSHEATALYSPLPPKELLTQKKRRTERNFSMAEKCLENYSEISQSRENIWDITGDEAVISRVKEIVGRAKKRILLEMCPEEAEQLKEKLREASDRGVDIAIVALGKIPFRFAKVCLHSSINNIYTEYGGRWIIISADDKEVLAGIVSLGAESRAATTMHPGLVMPITEEIIHDLYIGEMMDKHREILEDSFGPNLEKLRQKYNVNPDSVRQWLASL